MSVANQAQQKRRGFHWGYWLGGLILLVGVGALGLGLRHGQAKPDEADKDAVPLELAPADVAQVQKRSLRRDLPVSGSLTPIVQATVKSQVSGDVLEVTVREGQTVKRGEVLVRIDPRNLAAEVDSQTATLEKARADLLLATQNRDNSKALLEQHFISQNAYDSTVNAFSASKANVKLAEAQLRLAELNLGYTVVRAPFDGTISKRLVDPGEKVSPDTPLMGLVDLTQMELQVSAPAPEVPSIHVGQHAAFHVAGFGDRSFDGVVRRINPMADESSRAIMVYLAVANPDGALKGGMFAQAELTLDQSAPMPSIPLAAVHGETGAEYVFELRDGQIVRKPVELGMSARDEGFVEVRGLEDGAHVIVAKIESLKDGTKAVMSGQVQAEAQPQAKTGTGGGAAVAPGAGG